MAFGGRVAAITVSVGLFCAVSNTAQAAAKDDINGVWMVQSAYTLMVKLPSQPELKPEAAAARQRLADANAKGYTRAVSNMLCQGVGGPSLFQSQSPFEIFSGFGRVTFIFETEWTNQPRTVYLNEAKQPDNIFPSYNGHSIGHWEGDTLVVDTVAFNGRNSHRGNWLGGIPRSDAAHLTERFSLSEGGKVLNLEITTVDPKVLEKPWTVLLKFDRMADTEERFEVTCETDLDALNATDMKALKDADPEVARLLDPTQRESDPALKIAAPKK